MPKPYTLEQKYDDVLHVRSNDWTTGDEQWFLLASDVHWDNPHCNRKMWKSHLDRAVERGAGILIFGDFFCAMQGKYDKRSSKEAVRPEHQTNNYLDSLVDTAAAYMEPYKSHIVMISDGNHETSIKKHQETDLLERLCRRLDCVHLGYSGFVKFMFSRQSGGRTSRNLYFTHGYGGGGPVTKGAIQTNRRAVYTPDAHIVTTGHIHERFTMSIPRVRLADSGKTFLDEQVHIQLATYKDEFTLSGGWHVERGAPPKPLGGTWLRFFYDSLLTGRIGFETTEAK